MAETIIDAGPIYLSAAAATILTATNQTILGKLHVVNADTSDRTLTVSIGTDGTGKRIYDTFTVKAGGVLDDTGPYKLDAGEVLQAYADVANKLTIYVAGVDTGGTLDATLLPWTIDIEPLQAVANTTWITASASASASTGGSSTSSGAQNSSREWDVVLGAGTWTIELLTIDSNAAGIYTVQLDGVTVGTADGYNAIATYDVLKTLTGITVAASGKKRLKIIMATKNGSSGAYYAQIEHIQLRRTA